MARTKRGVVTKAKHKKVLKTVKGQYGRRKNTIRIASSSHGKGYAICLQRQKSKKKGISFIMDTKN